ncbi:hypothetical protein JQC67_11700 [Aurantibacter crassamenti]|uniref:hypothetical protein n=1 Tax=Aurantibacter crassamenti TaxID=1837375 RepID=UPI00193A13BF|nr:hypothetical protein [Aurantibacter crassamenti]MBM1106806.1 hypothetical protein [Aurantibacter crassamenti]
MISRISGIVLAFYLIEKVLFRITSLPFDSYSSTFIYWEFLKKIGSTIYIPILCILLVIIYAKHVVIPWKSFEKGNQIRLFLTAIGLILTWIFSTYNYNYYFDQWHVYDRILLCATALLIFYRPIFVVSFLSMLLPIIGQEEVIQLFSLAAPLLPIRLLILFTVFLFARIVFKRFNYRDFVFMVSCLVGVHYFASGIRKVFTGFEWILYNKINYLVPSMYGNGWFSWASPEFISSATAFLEYFNFPLKVFTLSIEIGVLFMFINLKWARYCLIGAIIMHMGIVVYSGIFFWLWSLILILVLYFFLNEKAVENSILFTKKYFVVAFFLIGMGQFWSRPIPLSWLDTPLNYTHKFFAETANGNVVQLTPKFFSPYVFQFTTGKFKYLNNEPRLPILWGATNVQTSSFLRVPQSEESISNFESENGKIYYNEKSKSSFIDFVQRFVSNWNESYPGENYMDYIQPPRMLLTFPTDLFSDGKDEIVKVKVIETTTLYSKEKGFREIRNKELLEINIPIE